MSIGISHYRYSTQKTDSYIIVNNYDGYESYDEYIDEFRRNSEFNKFIVTDEIEVSDWKSVGINIHEYSIRGYEGEFIDLESKSDKSIIIKVPEPKLVKVYDELVYEIELKWHSTRSLWNDSMDYDQIWESDEFKYGLIFKKSDLKKFMDKYMSEYGKSFTLDNIYNEFIDGSDYVMIG